VNWLQSSVSQKNNHINMSFPMIFTLINYAVQEEAKLVVFIDKHIVMLDEIPQNVHMR